jgi:hypothetical protein
LAKCQRERFDLKGLLETAVRHRGTAEQRAEWYQARLVELMESDPNHEDCRLVQAGLEEELRKDRELLDKLWDENNKRPSAWK